MQTIKSHGNVTFHASVKTWLPPVIVDQFCDDDGELNYVLANGHTSLASRYNSLWHPKPGIVNWNTKGDSIGNKQTKIV